MGKTTENFKWINSEKGLSPQNGLNLIFIFILICKTGFLMDSFNSTESYHGPICHLKCMWLRRRGMWSDIYLEISAFHFKWLYALQKVYPAEWELQMFKGEGDQTSPSASSSRAHKKVPTACKESWGLKCHSEGLFTVAVYEHFGLETFGGHDCFHCKVTLRGRCIPFGTHHMCVLILLFIRSILNCWGGRREIGFVPPYGIFMSFTDKACVQIRENENTGFSISLLDMQLIHKCISFLNKTLWLSG